MIRATTSITRRFGWTTRPQPRRYRSKSSTTSLSNKTTEIAVGTAAVVALLGANLWINHREKGRATANNNNIHSNGDVREDDNDDPTQFRPIAKATRQELQNYLSIVADGEKYDSLLRLQKIASLTSRDDRRRIFQTECTAVQDTTDDRIRELSPRNRNLLRRHLGHQQALTRILTCDVVAVGDDDGGNLNNKNNYNNNRGNNKKNVCSQLMGRALTEQELMEAKSVAHRQVEKLLDKTRDLCEDC
mmetsp:Transcript_4910/g.13752  ORF Transcript_4910/g.13752 Transcript_4910/m.13752 type:complete len:246 (+) Transcript_4910:144-881(+)